MRPPGRGRGLLDTLSYFLDTNQESELQQKAWETFRKANEALSRARQQARQAAAAAMASPTPANIARRARTAKALRANRRLRREAAETYRESSAFVSRRSGRNFVEGFKGSDVGGAAARGAQEGGIAGAAVGGGAALAEGVTTGMALAFGGPYGPLIAKGIKMFGGLVVGGFKLMDSMNHWAKATEERTYAMAQSSPHMFAVKAQRQFLDMLEDMQRGAGLAEGEQQRNVFRAQRRREERLAEINERHMAQRWENAADAAAMVRGRISSNQAAAGNRFTSWIMNQWGVRHVLDAATLARLAAQEVGLADEDRSFQMFQEQRARTQEIQARELAEAAHNLDLERATQPGVNPFDRGGFFDLVRPEGAENSMTEQVFRMGMGGDWASNAGLPDRWKP